MTSELVSFVIPAYNVSLYVEACLDSIYALQLPMGSFEVIVIDDGSTDDTARIVSAYGKRRPNLRLLRQHNQGQSVARNRGIDEAHGEYIYFVDADDTLVSGAVLPVAELESGRFDIIGIDVLKSDGPGHLRPYSSQKFPYGQVYSRAAEYLACHNVLGIVYGYFFKRDFLWQSQLKFTPGIYHQDEEFVVCAFCAAASMIYCHVPLYIYIRHEGSSIHTFTEERRERLMNDTMLVLHHLVAMSHDSSELAGVLHYKLSFLALDVLRLLIRQQHRISYVRTILAQLREMSLYPLPAIPILKYWVVKCLTASEKSVIYMICHPKLARIIGF